MAPASAIGLVVRRADGERPASPWRRLTPVTRGQGIGTPIMPRNPEEHRRGLRRVRWLLLAGFIIAGGAWGSYELYVLRLRQNTGKLLVRAQEAVEAEDWDAAAVAYGHYLQRQPDDVEALEAYADVLLERLATRADATAAAIRVLRRLVSAKPDSIKAVRDSTGLYLAMRDFGPARDMAQSWLTLAPDSPDAALGLAAAQRGLRKSDEAARTLAEAIERSPGEAKLYPLLVTLLADDLDRPDAAAHRLEQALVVGPESGDVQLAAFWFHSRRGTTADADRHLRLALDSAPESLRALLSATTFYLSRDRPDEARECLDRAGEIAPGNRNVLLARALWARKQGEHSSLLDTADALLDYAQDTDRAFIENAAELYLRAGSLTQADECLKKLAELPGSGSGADLNLLRGIRAALASDHHAAISHLRAALRGQPPDPWALHMLAVSCTEVGDLEAAADAWRLLVRHTRDDKRARLQLAELSWRQGRLAEAVEAVRSIAGPAGGQTAGGELVAIACSLWEREGTSGFEEYRASLRPTLDLAAASGQHGAASKLWLVRCLVLGGLPDKAVALFDEQLVDEAAGIAVGAELIRLFLAEGLTNRADKVVDALIREFPLAVEPHVLRIEALASQGRIAEATTHVIRCGLPVDSRGPVHAALGRGQVAAGQVERGLESLRLAAMILPRDIAVRQQLARHTPELSEAHACCDEIRLIEGDAGLHWKLERAATLIRLARSDESAAESRELLDQCLAERPEWRRALILLGRAHERAGRLAQAVEAYRSATAHRAERGGDAVAIHLVELLNQLGRFGEADSLLRSLASSSNEPSVLHLETRRQLRVGDIGAALQTAERLAELEPRVPARIALNADLHLQAGDAARAEVIAKRGLQRFPGSTIVEWSLCRALLAQGRGDSAEAVAREAAQRSDDAPHYLVYANVLSRLDREADAEAAVARAQKAAPRDADTWAACADFWAAHDRRKPQLDCARKSVALRGVDPSQSLAIARLLIAGTAPDEHAEAGAIVRRRLGADPNDAEALVLSAQLAVLQTPPDLAAAEADLTLALSIDARLVKAYKLLGSVQFRDGRFQEARETVLGGIAIAAGDPDLLLASAEIHAALGAADRAIASLGRLLSLRPRMPAAQRLLARVYREAGQADRAIAFLEAELREGRRTADELTILAGLYEHQRDGVRAGELLRRAHKLDRRSARTHRELLRFQLRQGHFEGIHALASDRRLHFPEDVESWALAGQMLGGTAPDPNLRDTGLRWLGAIARDHPEHAADALHRSALCSYQRGEVDPAENMFRKALDRSPTHPGAVNDLAWLYTEDRGDPERALALIDRYLEAGGAEGAHLLDTYGVALMRAGRLDEARRKLTACLRLAGRSRTRTAATFHLGLLQIRGGEVIRGGHSVREALDLDGRLGGLTDDERAEALRIVSAPNAPG